MSAAAELLQRLHDEYGFDGFSLEGGITRARKDKTEALFNDLLRSQMEERRDTSDRYPLPQLPSGETVDFEVWRSITLDFLRRRRYAPFDSSVDVYEAHFFASIDERADSFARLPSGKDLGLMGIVHTLRNVGSYDPPLEFALPHLWILYEDEAKVREVAGRWGNGGEMDFLADIVHYIERQSVSHYELLRHRRLLPEQRKLCSFLEKEDSKSGLFKLLGTFWERAFGKISGNEYHIKLAWARSWREVSVDTADGFLSEEQWDEAYGVVLGTMGTPALYDVTKDFIWELAELNYHHAPDKVRRLLGGTLFTTILDIEDAEDIKEEVALSLSPLVADDDLFTPQYFNRFHPSREAGCFHVDTGNWFVFKRTTSREADALLAVNKIMKDPAATEWRLAARYDEYFRSKEVQAGMSPGGLAQMMRSYGDDPALQAWFDLPCVKDTGLVIQGEDDSCLITMHNAGRTLAQRLKEVGDKEGREKLCRDDLEKLAKFHLIVTENLTETGGVFYASPMMADYAISPVVPLVDFRKLIERRVVGSGGERLGDNGYLRLLSSEVHRLSTFLELGLRAAVMLDTDDTNITERGIIDLQKLGVGNMMYDVARFLYGPSWRLKGDVDRAMLRDHYISTLTSWVSDTSVVHNTDPDGFVKHRKEMDKIKTWEKLRKNAYAMFVQLGDGIMPHAKPAFVEAATLRSVNGMLMDWYCDRPSSVGRMREECQAAAILVTMGEVGALVRQLRLFSEGSDHYRETEYELRSAVHTSLTLMHYQGFHALGKNWRTYLKGSGKIPNSYLVDDPMHLGGCLIGDLSTRIDDLVWEARKENTCLHVY